MDEVEAIVTNSQGSCAKAHVKSERVKIGSILELEGHYGVVADMSYMEDMKIGSRQKLMADVEIFGRLKGEKLIRIKRPVKPGTCAKIADEKELEKVLTVEEENISIGCVCGTGARAKLKASEYDRHMAVLASTGSGKSYTAANIIKEYANLGLPVLVVDTHGEYTKLLERLSQENRFKLRQYTVKHQRSGFESLTIPLNELEAYDFSHFISLTEPQLMALDQVIDKVSAKQYLIEDMVAECGNLDAKSVHEATQQALARKLTALKRMGAGVFDKVGTDVDELIEPGQVTIIDTSLASNAIRRSVISYLAKELLQGRVNKVNDVGSRKVNNPLLFVVEEAHNYAGSNLTHSCKRQLSRVASEGRKFGIGLMVISQKPSKIDEEILSQCNSGIYMHITNPKDKDHIKKSFEAINEDIVKGLDMLDVAEAIIAGPLVDIPFVLVEVDRIDVEKDKKSKFKFEVKKDSKPAGFDYH